MGAEEQAPHLRALVALVEEPGSSVHMVFPPVYNSSSEG